MIGFFRRIRKKLADDNQLLKYSRYAVGEILLVMVGILLALQVNNWNEERKERIVEREYLESLKAELNANKNIALFQIEFSKFQSANASLILAVISGDTILINSESLLVAIENVGWNPPSSYFEQNVWQELFSTGNMSIIQNKILRTEFSNLYREMNRVMGFGDEWNSYNQGIRRLLGSVTPVNARFALVKNLGATSYSGNIKNLPNFKSISTKLKEIKGIDGYLFDIAFCRDTGTDFCNQIIERIDKIIIKIDEELENTK
jgi:hypothetical protein